MGILDLQRSTLGRTRLAGQRDITIVGEAGDGASAVTAIRTHLPELLFLDIQMPGMDGFDVLRALDPETLPVVIFVTAYDRYALEAFEAHALDYLLKPFSAARVADALSRARHELEREGLADRQNRVRLLVDPSATSDRVADRTEPAGVTRLPVRDGERYVLLGVQEIDYFESAGNYVRIHARGAAYRVRSTLRAMENKLGHDSSSGSTGRSSSTRIGSPR